MRGALELGRKSSKRGVRKDAKKAGVHDGGEKTGSGKI